MATYYSNYSNEYRLRLDITQGTQSVTNNTTVVSWTLYLLSGNKSMQVYSTYSATVNGVSSPSTTQTNVTIGFNTSVTLGSGSTTVTHNADGTKSVAFSASFKANSELYSGGTLITPGGTMTISGTFALTTIPRYAAITAFTASINDRSATLSWTADKTISQWRWSTNSGSSYSAWTTVNSSSGSTSVSVSPGSTYGFRIQVKNSASGLITTSSVVSKTATKTPSTLTLSTTSQNVGGGITWTVNESYDYTHKITYAFGGASGYILGSSSAASNTATGTWTVPTSLANRIPNATSGSGTIYVYTYYGSVHVGTKSYSFTAKVPNTTTWQPTVPTVTITDAGSRPTGITSYVQGKAKAKVVSSSTAQGGASISSYRVTVSGIGTYYGSNITSGYLTKSGTVTITVRATDSRGYYREKASTITVVAYSPPKLTTYTALRSPNDQGTNLATSINFSISSIDNQNAKQYRIRYRPIGGMWVSLVDSTDYYTRSTTHSATDVLDVNSSYEVEFYIKDSYTSVTQMRNIGTAFQLLDFNASGRGVAFGKVSEGNILEVALDTEISGRLTAGRHGNVSISASIYHPSSGVLVDICEDTTSTMVFVEVVGNGYGGKPIFSIFQVYHYSPHGTLIQAKQTNFGQPLPTGKFLLQNGRIKLWFTQSSTYQTFVVRAYSMDGKIEKPSITNSSEPSVTYKVSCTNESIPTPTHTHAWSTITSIPATATRWPTWSEVTSKPSTFAPSSHSHAWSTITSKPSTFAPSTHTHTTGTNSTTGYVKFDNGIKINWATVTLSANVRSKTFTWASAFSSVYAYWAAGPHYDVQEVLNPVTTTGGTLEAALTSNNQVVPVTTTYKVFAIGV